jgi:MbtH protein
MITRALMSDREDNRTYRVVVNHEEQYALWLEFKEIPLGWRDAGKVGTKAECMAWVDEVWTDMRPLSLRRHLEEAEAANTTGANKTTGAKTPAGPKGSTGSDREVNA